MSPPHSHATVPDSARLLILLRTLPDLQLQNSLMACTDRDLAMVMRRFAQEERAMLMRHLAPAKRKRVVEELELQRRVRISDEHYTASLEAVLQRISLRRPQKSVRSYLRPRRDGRDTR